jgi:sugar phosphate isomerase/epimerase
MTCRRDFLKQSALLSAGFMVNKNSFFKSNTVGLQLYTVRSEVSKDKLAGTIKTIADAGYTHLELFGYNPQKREFFGHSVKQMADLLKQNNLKSPSGHYGLADMMHGENYNWDSWKYLLDDSKTLGHNYVVIPYLDDKHRTADDYKRLAERLNKGGEMARKMGMCAGYHNHDFEFNDLNGTNGWEILLENTEKKYVAMEMDIYWVVYAKKDPIEIFKKYPGRFQMWHVKDMQTSPKVQSTVVGEGVIDFKKLYEERKLAGLDQLYVEQEAYNEPVFDCIRKSYTFVKNNIVK